MNTVKIQENCKCCSCEKSLKDSKFLNSTSFLLKAKWEYPTWGNIITGEEKLALAYICDECYMLKSQAKFAVEFGENDSINYHPLSDLEEA